MSIRLSPRLLAIAELVPEGARVIDVGTDHAMIPVWLIQNSRASHVWASDLREGPLKNASVLVHETNTDGAIDLRQSDGLQGFSASDGDTVIISGLGGETIISILSDASWLKRGVLLILQPQTKQELLRQWLCDHDFAINHECIVKDSGRLYQILTASKGSSPEYSAAEYYTGRFDQIAKEMLFPEILEQLIRKMQSAAPFDPSAQIILTQFKKMKEKIGDTNHS